MSRYLDTKKAFVLYSEVANSPYFVDKSAMLEELIPLIGQERKYLCITRPRRFGKTVMANMISSFFGRGVDSRALFEKLEIGKSEKFAENINQYPVISMTLSEIPRACKTYEQYMNRIETGFVKDLKKAFPECEVEEGDAVWDILNDIFEETGSRFLFVLDEWDYLFHRDFASEKEKKFYIQFLSNLLKDKPYVAMAYMTGILPIAKYSSGSELNMFLEYTMVTEERFSDYFGFTETEVDDLYRRFLKIEPKPQVTREGLKVWYDGYHTKAGERVYNPRSVAASLTNNNLGSYWTSSGPYDEIFYYIENNVDEVRDDIALMVSGIPVPAQVQEYAAASMGLSTKDEIFSAMVVYGFLSYENGKVCIPNQELMKKFDEMLGREPSMGYVHRLAKESERMLRATLAGDTETMMEILEYAHNTEIPLLSYNNEVELTALVNLIYLAARDSYRIEREDKAGKGYVDFIFYPERRKSDDAIILELKVDAEPEEAIRQIKERGYALRLRGRTGEEPKYTGRILAVGISYDRKTKKHRCLMESL
ncbi:MAG: AAA family ATPase [Eubacteriales bacterium]|nr:AAA family ATPase [Eubacteriales bacterium]